MSSSQLLNHQFHQAKQSINSPTLVFIHGLFGDMNNLGVIARAFSDNYNILRVDLRNHGHSFHSETMNYDVMADDVWQLIDHLQLDKSYLNWSFNGWKNGHENDRTSTAARRKIGRH